MDFSGITMDDLPPTPPGANQDRFPHLPPSPPVTDQEFHMFHTVERKVYVRLIGGLHRDPIESVYVMAFWMWLEKAAGDSTIINRTLLFPGGLVNKLADETVSCLRCLTYKGTGGCVHDRELTLLPNLLQDASTFTFRFLHANRAEVKGRLVNILCTVTARSLAHLARSAINGEALPAGDDIPMQRDERLDRSFGVALSKVLLDNVTNQEKEEEEINRTVFLKLPDGCALTENEIREFFTRVCGEIIEKVSVQEVLRRRRLASSAYMVVRSKAVAKEVHGGDTREFVINGNRVRAKRYDVKKQLHFSSTISPWEGRHVVERS